MNHTVKSTESLQRRGFHQRVKLDLEDYHRTLNTRLEGHMKVYHVQDVALKEVMYSIIFMGIYYANKGLQ